MVKRELPRYVYPKGKRGYPYFTRYGKTQRIHSEPGTPEFWAEYALLLKGRPPAPARNVRRLVELYKTEGPWNEHAKNTQLSYGRHFDYFMDRMGAIDPGTIRPHHVADMRDALRAKPTDANRKLGALSRLLAYGVQRGWMHRNPCTEVEPLRYSKRRREPWPDDKIEAFREAADPETRLIFELLLGTGQRIGDVLKMRWQDLDADSIGVRQQKTDAVLRVPLIPSLRISLDTAPRHGETIVAQPNGRPYSYQLSWKRIMDVRRSIGAEHLDIHSLRYTTACEIIELPGMTLDHVKAITGHTAAETAALYAASRMVTARAREAQNARATKRQPRNAD